jgi:hypothetical protein
MILESTQSPVVFTSSVDWQVRIDFVIQHGYKLQLHQQ